MHAWRTGPSAIGRVLKALDLSSVCVHGCMCLLYIYYEYARARLAPALALSRALSASAHGGLGGQHHHDATDPSLTLDSSVWISLACSRTCTSKLDTSNTSARPPSYDKRQDKALTLSDSSSLQRASVSGGSTPASDASGSLQSAMPRGFRPPPVHPLLSLFCTPCLNLTFKV